MLWKNKLSQKDAKQIEDDANISSNPDGQNQDSQDHHLVNRKKSFKSVAESWKVSDPIHIPFIEPTNDLLLCCSWGMEVAFDVYQWAQTIKWPSCKEPLKGDCGITFLELLANFLLVTGKTIPVTIKRLGTRITWAPFNSEQSYIQPQRAKSAMAQAVVLDSIIQQLNRIFKHCNISHPKTYRNQITEPFWPLHFAETNWGMCVGQSFYIPKKQFFSWMHF